MAVKFSGKWFDMFKWVALILLPALAFLYATLGPVWGLPLVKEITGTIAAVDVFLGVLLGISSLQYRENMENPTLIQSSKTIVKVSWIPSDTTYDVLMWVAQVLLPGAAAFYFTLSYIWNLPEPEKVVTTIMALDTFLGMLLGFASSQFNKNAIFTRIYNSQK
jgi:hypothetical protein